MKEVSNIYCLVLSNGNYEGLGKTREVEMALASKKIGIIDTKIIDDPNLPDGFWEWNSDLVAPHVSAHIRTLENRGIKIGSILTFDDYGISNHPNHQAVHRACKMLYDKGELPEVGIYYLESVPMYKSYTFWLDIFNCD